jgi:hypothetical protein
VQDGKVNNGGQFNWTTHVSQNISWLSGKHEFKMGWDIRRLRTTSVDAAGTNGLFQFERAQTALPTATGTTGHSFASFLLGAPNQVAFTTLPVPDPQIRYGYHAGYFQDNWRIKSNLTLNLGMRYEVPVGFHMANFQFSAMDPTLAESGGRWSPRRDGLCRPRPGTDGREALLPDRFLEYWTALWLRLSRLASKTVVRGGFGIYYQTLGNGGCGCTLGFSGNPGTIIADGVAPALVLGCWRADSAGRQATVHRSGAWRALGSDARPARTRFRQGSAHLQLEPQRPA